MNSKSKIVLGLSAILAVSAGVAATSTYAWFTTSRTTYVSISNIGVKSNNGNLYAVASQSTDANQGGMEITTAGASDKNPVVAGTDSTMFDISGDGKTFYQPKWNAGSVNSTTGLGTSANDMYTVDNGTAGKLAFREFALDFYNGGVKANGDSSFAVYLDVGTGTTATTIAAGDSNSNSTDAANATRIAILDEAKANILFYYQHSTEANGTYQYIKADSTATTENGAYGVAGYTLAACSTINHNNTGTTLATITDGKSDQQKSQLLVAAIEAGAHTRVWVRIWLEGTCATCKNSAQNGVVASYLNFTAI
jgi:hypothetical protein